MKILLAKKLDICGSLFMVLSNNKSHLIHPDPSSKDLHLGPFLGAIRSSRIISLRHLVPIVAEDAGSSLGHRLLLGAALFATVSNVSKFLRYCNC